MSRRGALLLEIVLALAIFVAAGLTVLAMVNRGAATVGATRDRARAINLARSAMAKIEAGVARPETLLGPVRSWQSEEAPTDAPDTQPSGPDDARPGDRGWELDIKTEPTAYDGLTAVTVSAFRRVGAGERVSVSFTLTQFVRLTVRAPDGHAGGGGTP